jgi:UDP-N-acetylmuramate: L-alanyl-gamma-D-glutamyl-meso-diaminopimelate ligase
VYNAESGALRDVLAMGCWSQCEAFNSDAGWHFTSQGELDFAGQRMGVLALKMPGAHNRSNAMASIAAARHVGVQPQKAIAALREFAGVRRRLELRGTVRGIRVYDDFAHHPTAIAASIEALRSVLAPGERIVAVFEPRSNTMKTGAMRSALAPSLRSADIVFAYSAGLSWDVREALADVANSHVVKSDVDALVVQILNVARPGDHILCMSNGGFGGVHERLLNALQG